tara:strand:+ start:1913 stop:2050 length:138 start_codon:yes stop_codon:yes gene_type:complete
MNITDYNGIITISDIKNNRYIKKRYIYYTKKQAIKLFKNEIKEIK